MNKYTGVVRETKTPLKVMDVHEGVLAKQETFFACATCGKVYWQGSHWDKVKRY